MKGQHSGASVGPRGSHRKPDGMKNDYNVGFPASQVMALSTVPSAHAPGKAAENGPSAWAPATHAGDPDGVLGSCLAQT